MVRWLAVGLVLGLVSATGAESQTLGLSEQIVYLVRAEPLVDDISVSVVWDRTLGFVSVRVHKGSSEVEIIGGHPPKTAVDMAIQTWVLRSDGTALPRRPGEYPGFGTPSLRSAGWTLTWAFRYPEPNELTAVVVRVDGALFVRPIPQKPIN